MPIPQPNPGQSKEAFIVRPQKQKVAICFDIWRQAHKRAKGANDIPVDWAGFEDGNFVIWWIMSNEEVAVILNDHAYLNADDWEVCNCGIRSRKLNKVFDREEALIASSLSQKYSQKK